MGRDYKGYERLNDSGRTPAWELFKRSTMNARNVPNILLLGALGRRPITLAKLMGLKTLLKPAGFLQVLLPIIIVLLIADTLYTTFHLFKDNYGIDKNKKLRDEYNATINETLDKFPENHAFIGKRPELSRPENDFKHVYPAVDGYIRFFRRVNLLKVGFRCISLMVTLPYIFGATLPVPITMAVGGVFGFFLGLWVDHKDTVFNDMRDNEARETANQERMMNYYTNELDHMEHTEKLATQRVEEALSRQGSPISPAGQPTNVLHLRQARSATNLSGQNERTSGSPSPPPISPSLQPFSAKMTKTS